MKLLAIIGLALMCVIAISEAHGNGRNGKNIAQKYGQSKYNGLRSRKFGGGYGVGKKVPTNYQGYQGRLGPYQYRLGRYRFGNYRYGRYGHQYRLGYRRYGQKNSLGYGYKKGSAFYDEKEQDASGYYPRKYGIFRHRRYGQRYGFGIHGGKSELRHGNFGKNFLRHGHKKGYVRKLYYDEKEDPSRHYAGKFGHYPHQFSKYGKRCGFPKLGSGTYGRRYALGRYGHVNYEARYGFRKFGRKYQGYGHKKGYRGRIYKDGE